MTITHNLFMGAGSILLSGVSFTVPAPAPVQELPKNPSHSIGNDFYRVCLDIRAAQVHNAKELAQMELKFESRAA